MICMVTDRRRLAAGDAASDRLVDLVWAAGRAGIDLVHVRERDLNARYLVGLVRRCVAAVVGTRTKVVVNDRADVAVAADAAGVHLRSDSIGAADARSLLSSGALIGRSVHDSEEAAAVAAAGGVDYFIFGTLHQTASKDPGHPIATFDALRATCRAAAGIPVLGIGGMTVERARDAARAGASGIAGISLFVPPVGASADKHLQMVVASVRRAFDTSETVS